MLVYSYTRMWLSLVVGVPVSNQWDKKGYIYPIQVAQFGLSHYSKSLTDEGAESDRYVIRSLYVYPHRVALLVHAKEEVCLL